MQTQPSLQPPAQQGENSQDLARGRLDPPGTDGQPHVEPHAELSCPGAAARARVNMDLLDVSYKMRWELERFDLKPTERRIMNLFLMLTYDAGKDAHFMANPQRRLADMLCIEDKDFFRALKKLERDGFVARAPAENGMVYWPDPDFGHWLGTKLIEKSEADRLRAAMQSNPQQLDLQFANAPEEPLAVVLARLGLRSALQAAILQSKGEISPSDGRADLVAASTKGEIPPSGASAKAEPGASKGEFSPLRAIAVQPEKYSHKALRAIREDREIKTALMGLGPPWTESAKKHLLELAREISGGKFKYRPFWVSRIWKGPGPDKCQEGLMVGLTTRIEGKLKPGGSALGLAAHIVDDRKQ